MKIWKINSDIYELHVRNILSYILSLSMTYWLVIIRITQICQLDVCKKCLWKNFAFFRSQYVKWCVRCLYIVSYESVSREKDLWFTHQVKSIKSTVFLEFLILRLRVNITKYIFSMRFFTLYTAQQPELSTDYFKFKLKSNLKRFLSQY